MSSGIPPGGHFDYVVPINSSGQWGTYWAHAHAGVCSQFRDQAPADLLLTSQGQYVDGLRTSFSIHPPTEVYTYDEEFTVILGDWYHEQHSVLIKQFINIANPGGAEPVPGRYYYYYAPINSHFMSYLLTI